MITTQSTPPGDNPFYNYHMRARAYGRRFDQLAAVVHHLRIEPDKAITVIAPNKEVCEQFIKFADDNHVILEVTKITDYGPNAKQYTIKSFSIKEFKR